MNFIGFISQKFIYSSSPRYYKTHCDCHKTFKTRPFKPNSNLKQNPDKQLPKKLSADEAYKSWHPKTNPEKDLQQVFQYSKNPQTQWQQRLTNRRICEALPTSKRSRNPKPYLTQNRRKPHAANNLRQERKSLLS